MGYIIYVADCETTGLDAHKNDIIEVSFYRTSDEQQKTWCMHPFDMENIDDVALKINGHKREDITLKTAEGKARYKIPADVLVEIENWVLEDGCTAEERVLCGQNIPFDREFFQSTWKKAGASETYPFGRRYVDTMMFEFYTDFARGEFSEGYSLKNLCKKYGVKNDAAHTAAADTLACKEVFFKQLVLMKELLASHKL